MAIIAFNIYDLFISLGAALAWTLMLDDKKVEPS